MSINRGYVKLIRDGDSKSAAGLSLIASAVMVLSLGVVTAPSAVAYVHNLCRQESNSYIGVDRAGMSARYSSRLREGMSDWNNKQSYIAFIDSPFPAATVMGYSAKYDTSAYGITSYTCVGTRMQGAATLRLNERTLGDAGRNDGQIRQVGIHELGHSLGISHTNKTCAASVMVYNACIGNVGPYPYWDDINAVKAWGY